MKNCRLTIAATRGGEGKTLVSVGLAAALRRSGLSVRAFKKGPDFIDASWLESASGAACYNLDTFMMGDNGAINCFAEKSAGFDISIIEGNRGMFDGMDSDGSHSTARLAALAESPVILVLDATKSTRSLAATVKGFMSFDGGSNIKGVILNRVGGIRHQGVVKESIEKYCGIPVIGSIPKLKSGIFPERHMGLTPPQETVGCAEAVEELADVIAGCVDLEAARSIAASAPDIAACGSPETSAVSYARIGVFIDSAFQFYYRENLEALQRHGAELLIVSPLSDAALPDVDALYIGGGFPETHAARLADNESFRKSLRDAVVSGMPVWAECGGAVYIGRSLSVGGEMYEMAGVFPVDFSLGRGPCRHGYTVMEVAENNPFLEKGAIIRGHEFHYTAAANWKEGLAPTVFRMVRGAGLDGKHDGMRAGNAIAMYNHIHERGAPGWAVAFAGAAAGFAAERKTKAAL